MGVRRMALPLALAFVVSCGGAAEAWATKTRAAYEAEGWELISETRAASADTFFQNAPVRLAFGDPRRVTRFPPNLRIIRVLWL